MSNNFDNAAASVGSDMASLRGDIASLADRIAELAQQSKEAAKSQFHDAVGDAQKKIGATAANAQSHIIAAGSDFEASIERNPLAAVALAFGVGMGFGMINRARK